MANSPMRSARIQPGSALERMLQGRSFTALIHELADRVDQMQRAADLAPDAMWDMSCMHDPKELDERG